VRNPPEMGGFSLSKNFQKTLPYDLTNVRKVGIIETRRKEQSKWLIFYQTVS
jgi:hypothetical protein